MRLICLIVLSCLASSFAFCQATEASKAKETKAFSLNPDDLGALENSVNLFTGQVAFPMNVASTPGRGGLGITVNIHYNSNVKTSIGKRNADYPTGILGLGWSIDIPKIVANNKLTGAKSDDDYYLVEGGQSKKLVCLNSTSYPRTYEVRSPDFWKVQYYEFDEKWVITRENGFKYVYGDKNSNRGTVQWMVRWGNWIGNSVMPTGQQQQAYIWNIAEVENLWGDKMRFEYENVEEFVAKNLNNITTEKKHTKASYLKKITDAAGYSVDFIYGEKTYDNAPLIGKREYQDPHTEQSEPDAYQEKYETRYLDRLIVNNHDGALLYETSLEYTTNLMGLVGSGDEVKRLLTSITQIYPTGRSLPPVQFEYFTSGDFIGSMKKVTNAYGAYYEYTYTKSKIPFSDLDITVDAPTPGQWKEHYVYTGNDYAIVVWRTVNADGSHNAGFRPCKIWLYHWDGKWNKKDLTEGTEFGYINLKTRENDEKERILDWQIALGEYFFAYMYQRSDFPSNYETKIWYKRESTGTDWNLQSTGTGDEFPVLQSGDNFVAISNLRTNIRTYVFNGDGINFIDIDPSDNEIEIFWSAANNYIFVHNDNGGHQDYIHIYHLSPDKKWVKTSAPSTQLIGTDGDGFKISYWHAFNSFTMGLPWDNDEYIYMWDENFNAIKRLGGWGRFPDDAFVFSRNNNMLTTVPRKDDRGIDSHPFYTSIDYKSARYNGNAWQFNTLHGVATHKNVSLGTDFTFHDIFPTYRPRRAILQDYDPNIPGWKPFDQYTQQPTYVNTKDGANEDIVIEAGSDSFIMGDGDVYRRNFQGDWNYSTQLKLGSNEYILGNSLIQTPSLIAYEYSLSKTGSASGSYIATLKNGRVDQVTRFSGKTFETKPTNHVGANLIAHVDNSTRLILRKLIENNYQGKLYVNHVSQLKWYDGSKTFRNSYDYHLPSAKLDPNGSIAYFNKVGVIPGSPNTVQRPFGHTDYYFFNGLHPDSLAAVPMNRYAQSYRISLGELYQTCTISAAKDTVASSQVEHSVFQKIMKNSENKTVDVDSYTRPTKTLQMTDSVFTETASYFHSGIGLLDYTMSKNSARNQYDPTYNRWYPMYETRYNYVTYWWEIYDPQRTSSQWLSDVVQVTSIRGNPLLDTLSSTVTRWKTWENGRRSPDNIYSWRNRGTINFPSWNAPAVPPSADWQTAAEIKRRDLLTGTVLETRGVSGITESVIYDETRTRILAKISNAPWNSVAFSSFEWKAKGNWLYGDSAVHRGDTAALTGDSYFQHASAVIESANLPSGQYTVTVWTRDGSPQLSVVNGSVTSTKTYTPRRGWTLHRFDVELTATGKVTVQSAGTKIDELRLHPSTAKMNTTTYNAVGHVTAEVTVNHQVVYYTYDDMNRPVLIKDQDLNIVKRFDYRYRDEEEHLTGRIQLAGQIEPGGQVELSVVHPQYASDTVSYTWYLGDDTRLTNQGPTLSHAYTTAGFYKVQVFFYYPNSKLSGYATKTVQIPERLTASARISSGSSTVISCPQSPNTSPTGFSATVIDSNCEGYTYTWFYSTDGSGDIQFDAGGATVSYLFTYPGVYHVYCRVTNTCGQTVNTVPITITVQGDELYCGTEEQN